MMWLVGQVWMWMLLSALLGAGATVLLGTRRVTLERLVEVPVEQPEDGTAEQPEDEAAAEEQRAVTAKVGGPTSPFPSLPGADPSERPWEEEELWSRPARVVRSSGPRSEAATDEWSEAAQNWRTWAAETAGQVPRPDLEEDPSPAGSHARRAPEGGPAAGRHSVDPFPTFPASAAPPEDPFPPRGVESEFPHAQPVEADFSYAQPVEAHARPADAPGGPDGGAARQEEEERAVLAREQAKWLEAARLEAERQAAGRRDRERQEASAPQPEEPVDESWRLGPYGPGSAYAPFDGSAPQGYSIKGNKSTMLYHPLGSRFYSRTEADVWFQSEAAAEAAGFTRWDRRGTAAHASLREDQAGRRDDGGDARPGAP